MMKKKVLSMLLAAGMTMSACSGMAVSAEETAEPTKLTAVFIAHALTQDLEEMEWLAEIEKEANVEIEWEVIRADWETVKSTRFASGDIPDLLFNATNDADYSKYKGLFMELTPYLNEELTPNIMEMFETEPDTMTLVKNLDGNIYCTPKFQGKWPDTNTVLFINQNWLDNLGLEVPTTFSEFKEVLTAFKEQDANGNGDSNDEIPFDFNAGPNNGWFNSAYSLTALMGAMGIQLTGPTDSYFAEDGQVKSYAVDERYKLFMEYMADLYANGLINPNAITNDYSTFQSLSRGNEAGEALVGCVFGWEETDKFGPTLHEQYVPVPALDYDIDCEPGTYDTRWRYDYAELNFSSNRVAMSAKCENPEAAMKFVDRFYDQTHSVETLFGGITDGNIEKTGDNSYKVLPPQDPNTDSGTWKWTTAFADNGPMYIRRATEVEMAQDMAYALEERVVYEDVLAKPSALDTYQRIFLKFTEEDENTMAMAQANVNNIIDNQWSLWLTGQQDIESTWDSYVQSVYDAGLQQILDIRQKAFDSYLEKLESEAPEAETEAAETEAAETEAAETEAVETEAAETEVVETEATETEAA